MNCGNISAGVPVFALMKNMVPGVKDGLNTIRVYSTNTKKMMYLTVDVLNGEARVDGDCEMAGVPGTGSKVLVDFREQRVPSPASSSLQAASWTRSRWMTGPRSTSQSRTWLTPASSSRPRTSVSDGARASQSRLVAERTARRDIDNELGFGKRLSLRLENGEASGPPKIRHPPANRAASPPLPGRPRRAAHLAGEERVPRCGGVHPAPQGGLVLGL